MNSYKLTINVEDLTNLDMTGLALAQTDGNQRHHLLEGPGQAEHRLLAYLSTLVDHVHIADIGSRMGNSAIALSYNLTNKVDSFDINAGKIKQCKQLDLPNVEFFHKNLWSDLDDVLKYTIINLDIDPHGGTLERGLCDFLSKNNWTGIVVIDDIGPSWPKMVEMWSELPDPKFDVTRFGHASGTGLVPLGIDLVIE